MNIKKILGSLTIATTVALGSTFGVANIAAAEPGPGYIAGQDYGSRVTLRSGPSTSYGSKGYGLVGQDVRVIGRVYNQNDGYFWAKVYFYESGAVGYMRGDFVNYY